MDFESRQNEDDRRSRPRAVIAKRVRTTACSLGILVVIAGCAQGAVTTAKMPLIPSSVGHSVFGHPKTRSGTGQPNPTAPGRTPAAAASHTPAPAIDVNVVSRSKPSPSPSRTPRPTPVPKPSPPPHSTSTHVLVIMEENKGYKATLGSCGADPYWCSLAARYASATSWSGVTHPSEPNYVAIASGGLQGCTSDTACAANSLSQTDLGGQLTANGVPWVGWMESMPSACSTSNGGGYVLKHNPFGFFRDNYVGTCHIQPYPGVASALRTLDGAGAPDFAWITPNLTNDMHDGSVQQGDLWLSANLAPILASPWFLNFNSTVIVTMDENDAQSSPAGGQVPTVIISSLAAHKGGVAAAGNEYGLLRSIEEAYRLPLLGLASNPGNGDLRPWFG
jgi:phosphatidylinositol-3-phosphatase